MNEQSLRIAISGPVGAGKSTLAKALAEKYGIPMLEENFNEIHKTRHIFKQLQATPGVPKARLDAAYKNWVRSYFLWVRQRADRQSEIDGFVADRWEADLVSFWLRDLAGHDEDRSTMKLIRIMRAQSERLTLAVVLPAPLQVLEPKNETGLLRSQSLCTRLLGSAMMYGLILQHTRVKCISLPGGASSTEERIDRIEQFIRKVMRSA